MQIGAPYNIVKPVRYDMQLITQPTGQKSATWQRKTLKCAVLTTTKRIYSATDNHTQRDTPKSCPAKLRPLPTSKLAQTVTSSGQNLSNSPFPPPKKFSTKIYHATSCERVLISIIRVAKKNSTKNLRIDFLHTNKTESKTTTKFPHTPTTVIENSRFLCREGEFISLILISTLCPLLNHFNNIPPGLTSLIMSPLIQMKLGRIWELPVDVGTAWLETHKNLEKNPKASILRTNAKRTCYKQPEHTSNQWSPITTNSICLQRKLKFWQTDSNSENLIDWSGYKGHFHFQHSNALT